MTRRASVSSRPRTARRTASSTTLPSRAVASRPSPKASASSSTSCRARKVLPPRTSRSWAADVAGRGRLTSATARQPGRVTSTRLFASLATPVESWQLFLRYHNDRSEARRERPAGLGAQGLQEEAAEGGDPEGFASPPALREAERGSSAEGRGRAPA